MTIRGLGVLGILFLLFSNCEHKYEYSEMKNIGSLWYKKDTLVFNFDIKNIENKRDINIVLRNNNDYPYSNIYLFVKLKQNRKTISTDTIKYRLADNQGKWTGTGIGTVKEIQQEYKKEYQFPKEGKYQISIVQGMRKDTLKGIEDLGVNIK